MDFTSQEDDQKESTTESKETDSSGSNGKFCGIFRKKNRSTKKNSKGDREHVDPTTS